MLMPLVILAVLSMIGGWQAAPALWGGQDHFEKYLRAGICNAGFRVSRLLLANWLRRQQLNINSIVACDCAALIGLFLAWWMYIKSPDQPAKLAEIAGASI